MAQITFPFLTSLNSAVSTSYNSQLYAAASIYKQFCFENPSTGSEEVYPRLDMFRGLREWLGDRIVNSLSILKFTIANRTFEETIGVRREDIEDDRYGILNVIAQELGQNAGRFPDLLVAALMKQGTTSITIDGQNFFDFNHPNYNSDGTLGTIANTAKVTGAGAVQGPGWYFIDDTRVLKPFIFQTRRPFQIIPKFSMVDQQVFWNKEFEWGVDGRCNAGFGLWQLAYYSTQPLTPANLNAARAAMATIRRPDGAPMGISLNKLIVPTSLFIAAKSIETNEFDVTQSTTTLVVNPMKGMFRAIENPWLN